MNVQYAGRIYDEKEIENGIAAVKEFWLTEGKWSEDFAYKIKHFLNVRHCFLVNSGSSANLIALSALTSERLENRLQKGDHVITVAAGFPSTVSPIIQNGLIPVYVDIDLDTYNIDIAALKAAITEKTRAIMIAHTLGNPFNIDAVLDICSENGLWLIEDNCDSFGSLYNNRYTGTFGHISTLSFYPAHHITTGEGGAVMTNDDELATIIKSFRDWGRDCVCDTGESNYCGKRFQVQYGNLPLGYDHKYVFSEVGYNLKMTDIQAAIGCAQMDKLSSFIERRRYNWNRLNEIFNRYSKFIYRHKHTDNAIPSWFAYVVTVRHDAPFKRYALVKHLNKHNIELRYLFAGNITKQPGYMNKESIKSGELNITDYIMNNTFFMGVYPGITDAMLDYISDTLESFFKDYL